MWILPQADHNTLIRITNKMNKKRTHEEWLWSHPADKNNSTPVPILIQQDLHTLTEARRKNKQKETK